MLQNILAENLTSAKTFFTTHSNDANKILANPLQNILTVDHASTAGGEILLTVLSHISQG